MLTSFGPRLINLGNPVSNHPLNYGLVSWWLGLPNNSGGSTLFDLVQTSRNNGTLTNGPTWVPSPNGFRGLSLTRSSTHYVTIPSTFPSLSGSYTLVFDLMPATVSSGANEYYLTADWSVSQRNYLFRITAGRLELLNGNGSTSQDSTCSGGSLSANQRIHVAATRSGTTFTIYLNGVSVGAVTGSYSGGSTSNGRNWYTGSTPASSLCYGGQGYDIRAYNRTLSASEIFGLYQQSLQGHPDTLNRYNNRLWSFGTGGAAFNPALSPWAQDFVVAPGTPVPVSY